MPTVTDTDLKWIQIGVSFVAGGLAGAFVKQYFDHRRNRQQPIAYEVTLQSVYSAIDTKLLVSEIILTGATGEHKFSNLYSGSIIINNTGLQDFSDFDFGVTCSDNIKFIQVRSVTQDRHHTSVFGIQPELENQLSLFDVSLKPFNRGDSYQIDLLLTTTKEEVTPDDIQISTSHSVKLISITPIRSIALSSTIVNTMLPITANMFPLNLVIVPFKLIFDAFQKRK